MAVFRGSRGSRAGAKQLSPILPAQAVQACWFFGSLTELDGGIQRVVRPARQAVAAQGRQQQASAAGRNAARLSGKQRLHAAARSPTQALSAHMHGLMPAAPPTAPPRSPRARVEEPAAPVAAQHNVHGPRQHGQVAYQHPALLQQAAAVAVVRRGAARLRQARRGAAQQRVERKAGGHDAQQDPAARGRKEARRSDAVLSRASSSTGCSAAGGNARRQHPAAQQAGSRPKLCT